MVFLAVLSVVALQMVDTGTDTPALGLNKSDYEDVSVDQVPRCWSALATSPLSFSTPLSFQFFTARSRLVLHEDAQARVAKTSYMVDIHEAELIQLERRKVPSLDESPL